MPQQKKKTTTKGKSAERRRPSRGRRRAPRSTRPRAPQKGGASTYAMIARLLPEPVMDIEYVRRVLEILEDEERRAARLRAQRTRRLVRVWTDLQGEVASRIDSVEASTQERFNSWTDRLRATSVMRQVERLPGQVEDTFDDWLGRLGLVRKARVTTRERTKKAV